MALIEIGSTKQLFIDDYLIESLTDTKQVLNPAQKVDDNPVLRPERPWEGNVVRHGRGDSPEAPSSTAKRAYSRCSTRPWTPGRGWSTVGSRTAGG